MMILGRLDLIKATGNMWSSFEEDSNNNIIGLDLVWYYQHSQSKALRGLISPFRAMRRYQKIKPRRPFSVTPYSLARHRHSVL